MVREGHDSTVRPKVQTFEFDGGRMFLDAWASDGKPALTRNFQGWLRVLGVVTMTSFGIVLVLADWDKATHHQDHVFSSLQRGIRGWWATFIQMDEADVAKARSVQRAATSESTWSATQAESSKLGTDQPRMIDAARILYAQVVLCKQRGAHQLCTGEHNRQCITCRRCTVGCGPTAHVHMYARTYSVVVFI